MSIIPISSEEPVVYQDPETGAQFRFRRLLGRDITKYREMQSRIEKMLRPYIEQASKESEGLEAKEITRKAQMLAAAAGVMIDDVSYAADIVDMFLVGWEGEGFPEFPKSGKPSECFGVSALEQLTTVITERFEQLLGLTVDEAKNSMPRQS